MTILITGAAGFIGSQLAYKLWKRGEKLCLIDNFSYGQEDNLVFNKVDFRNQVLKIDIRDSDRLNRLIKSENINYIYNMAGVAPLPDCQLHPVEAIDVNVTGFVNVIECAKRNGVKVIVQASTNAIYENGLIYPSNETDNCNPTLIYPNTKLAAERFAASYSHTYGMNIVCLRFANVYGPHVDCLRKQPPLIAYMIRELYYDRVPVFHSDGEQRRDYIYVDDLVNLAIRAIDTAGFAIYNVSSNMSYSVNEIYDFVQKIMGKKIKPKYANANNFWIKYPELYSGPYSISTDVLNKEINKYTQCNNKLAFDTFGWKPVVQIESGLRSMVMSQCSLLDSIESDCNE